jgi:hypothetical protein
MPLMIITSDDWHGLMNTVNGLTNTVNRIDRNLIALNAHLEADMSDIDDAIATITEQVQANTDAEASAVAALHHLADLITANAAQPKVLLDLAAKLKSGADPLAAAMMNTDGPKPGADPAPADDAPHPEQRR